MAITNVSAGTNVEEIADGVYRINTPVRLIPPQHQAADRTPGK